MDNLALQGEDMVETLLQVADRLALAQRALEPRSRLDHTWSDAELMGLNQLLFGCESALRLRIGELSEEPDA